MDAINIKNSNEDYYTRLSLIKELSQIAKDKNITIITAIQPPNPNSNHIPCKLINNSTDVIFIDYIDLI